MMFYRFVFVRKAADGGVVIEGLEGIQPGFYVIVVAKRLFFVRGIAKHASCCQINFIQLTLSRSEPTARSVLMAEYS